VKIVLLGATKGIGRALARLLAERRENLFLLGRDAEELKKSAQDLVNRGAEGKVGTGHCDLSDPATFEKAVQDASHFLGGIEVVIITAGAFSTQTDLEADREKTKNLLNVNFTNTILFCEHMREYILDRGGGTLCVFSSVAGERGRKPVVLYGAAKAGLSYYLEGLDHKFRNQGLKVICVKPGFVKTSMTEGLKPPPFAAESEDVARDVLRAIDRATPEVYSPSIWRWIMKVIRCLPRFVMRKINF
jgi:decaprenylphospho-beta-D-erythro-pentofuranosid-2-ulose 2-reductase